MSHDLRQRALALQAEVMHHVVSLEATNECWKKCKDKTMGTSLSKNEKECFYHCTVAKIQAEELSVRRTKQHVEQQARSAMEQH